MSDRRSDAATRRPRWGPLATLVVLALVLGIALMAYAVQRSGGWFIRPAAKTDVTPPRAAAYLPPQPAPVVPQTAAVDPSALAARETGLSSQLSALEARTAAVALDAQGAAGQAARAETLLVAAAVRRAVERGAPLGGLEDQLRARFGATQPRAVSLLIGSARQPLTLDELRAGFDANVDRLRAGDDRDLLSSLSRALRTLVVLRKEGEPSTLPAARIERARRLLGAGRVDVALAEVVRLPGASAVGGWIAAARRYVRTRDALDLIESTALTMPMVAAPAPLSAPAPAPDTL
jgi:hypothetical protein